MSFFYADYSFFPEMIQEKFSILAYIVANTALINYE